MLPTAGTNLNGYPVDRAKDFGVPLITFEGLRDSRRVDHQCGIRVKAAQAGVIVSLRRSFTQEETRAPRAMPSIIGGEKGRKRSSPIHLSRRGARQHGDLWRLLPVHIARGDQGPGGQATGHIHLGR